MNYCKLQITLILDEYIYILAVGWGNWNIETIIMSLNNLNKLWKRNQMIEKHLQQHYEKMASNK